MGNPTPYYIGENLILLQELNTLEEKQKGFMFHDNPPNDDFGLLFMNEHSSKQSFWMKNVPFDLDLLGFDKSHCLVEVINLVANDEIPKSFKNDVLNVVEVRAGWVADKAVSIGSELLCALVRD